MTSPFDAEFTLGRPGPGGRRRRDPDGPAAILILGDFAGSASRPEPLASRPFVRVDPDNFDRAMERLGAALRLDPEGAAGPESRIVPIRSIEGFHPDALFGAVPGIQDLDRLRQRLRDPALFPSVAAELRTAGALPPASAPAAPAGAAEPDSGILERLLGRAASPGQPASPRPAEISDFLKRVVGPHIVAGPDPEQASMIASVEKAMAEPMRAALRLPGVRRLESAWRAVKWLLDEVGSDEERIALWLFDVSEAEMSGAAAGVASRLEADGPPTGGGWNLVLCDRAFRADEADLERLAILAAAASHAGAPLLTAASPSLAGAEDAAGLADPATWRPLDEAVAAAWRRLRTSPRARHLGLALPRFLLRLPYGKRTDPLELFPFEEMEPDAGPEELLWGNPAYLCARLIASAWLEEGEGEGVQEAAGLPSWSYTRRGQPSMAPCGEIYLPERAAERLIDAGFIPLVSQRGRPAVRVPRLQSVADPPAPLAAL